MACPNIKPLSSELQSLQKKDVKYALASFVDIHVMCKGKVVPLSHFDRLQDSEDSRGFEVTLTKDRTSRWAWLL
ncbi:MAG: hypothetical protein WBG63_18705 [Phormidesmis sp.]